MHDAGVAGRHDADPARLDLAAGRVEARNGARGVAADALHLAVLDDVDAERGSRAGIAPGDGVMPRHAAAALQGRAEDRVADVGRDVQDRAEVLRLFGRQPFIVDAGQAVGMNVPLEHLHVVDVMGQHHAAPRRIHDVVVQHLRQVLPQVQGVIIERLALFPKIVRADDRGVAPGIAAADPAFLDDRDVPHAVLGRHVIGGREAMSAPADDHGIVGGLRLGVAPLLRPAGVTGEALADEVRKGKTQRAEAPGASLAAALSYRRLLRSSTGTT